MDDTSDSVCDDGWLIKVIKELLKKSQKVLCSGSEIEVE